RQITVAGIGRAASVPFLLFVLGLGLVVQALSAHGLATAIRYLLPHGSLLPALLAVAFLAAAIANLVNNLPAVLVLLAAVTARGVTAGGNRGGAAIPRLGL